MASLLEAQYYHGLNIGDTWSPFFERIQAQCFSMEMLTAGKQFVRSVERFVNLAVLLESVNTISRSVDSECAHQTECEDGVHLSLIHI